MFCYNIRLYNVVFFLFLFVYFYSSLLLSLKCLQVFSSGVLLVGIFAMFIAKRALFVYSGKILFSI
jgi:hypothetical protein